ncbi:uncharacterized protein Triagg1_6434 [Trichoderma aggressivum f. europaeum]|uniref:Uncharacterized protein n=1 Tax=Trichoderma aggressivum f. europaeum TaxID=173218 RepID=A0AAE1M408_9HYPO|nr:hypothetical protein Triagg1_6434 [Trichoderma aggressivum f. europaeum]
MNGKSSSQWLRRLRNNVSAPKRKPSIEKKLHDEIMKSFLGQTETEQEPQEPVAKSASATSPSHVETQIRNTIRYVTQLMVRLNEKKAIFNVVDTYQKNGQDSVQHLKQQCLQDIDGSSNTSR